MLSKIIKGGLISGLLLASCAVASAQQTTTPQTEVTPRTRAERKFSRQEGRKGRMGRFGRGEFGKGIHALNLSDAQKEQFKALHQKFSEQFTTQRQEIRTLAKKKHEGTLTAEEQTKFDSLRGQMQSQREEMRKQMDALLTPEQIQQREQMKTQMKQRREEMRQRFEERRKQRQTQKPPTADGTVIK